MGAEQVLSVAYDEAGIRLDRWFKRHFPEISHGRLEKLLRTGKVRLDGNRAKANTRIEAGQVVRIPPLSDDAPARPRPVAPPPPISREMAKTVQGWVLHRDDDVIAIDKPAGLAVQGGSKTVDHLDAMLDALRFGSKHRPRLVHRLDKDTSGVLLLARHPASATALAAAFKSKTARKLYWAIVIGVPSPEKGTIDLALGKVGGKRGERVVASAEGGKRAITDYALIDRAGKRAALVALSPLTGRTHQLRVHMAELGTPILGDGKYGGSEAFLEMEGYEKRLHLHARSIRLPHPKGGELHIEAPPSAHIRQTMALLGLDASLAGGLEFPR
jgi:23S rRNA pseudouridine955/2504/2580 synthase